MLHLFGFVFNFCFHHLKLTKMSHEWVKMKKKKKRCFWVIEIELWWHFYNFTHRLGPTVNVPATLLPQRLSLNPYQTSPSFMILLLFSSSSQAVPFLSPYPLVYEFNKPSTWITKFFTLITTKNGIQIQNFNIQTLKKIIANTNKRIQHQLSLPHALYKFATHKQCL